MRPLWIAVWVVGTAIAWAQQPTPRQMPENVAIFAVRHDEKGFSIDPVVLVHYGDDQKFKTIPALNHPLPSGDWTKADFDKIEHSLYKPLSPVSIFLGGQKIGTGIVLGSNIEGRDGGCVDLSATISYSGKITPRLAANTSSEIPGHASTLRTATPTEELELSQLAQQWLVDYGLDRQLVPQGHLSASVSTELRKDFGRAIIGRFDVTSNKAIYRLFVVAESDGDRRRLTLSNLEVQNDLEDGTDKTEREYVDQLDIDNDASDEIITSATHYESWSYDIWKFDVKHKTWRHAFSGTGGGC